MATDPPKKEDSNAATSKGSNEYNNVATTKKSRKEDNNVATSRKRRKEVTKVEIENFRDLLECPVCSNVMCPPIHQCINGHTLCSSCKPYVHNRCPICRHELGNIRCLALEKVAASLELPCKYQCYGCVGVYPYSCKLMHESQCEYRPYDCPYPRSKCTVVGDIPYLVNHLEDVHGVKVKISEGRTIVYRYSSTFKSSKWFPTVCSCLGQFFCLHFETLQLGKDPFYIAFLRFMGEDSEAKKYRYTLEVGGSGRKMTWEGVPRSIRDSHTTVRDSYDGLLIGQDIAVIFSGGDPKKLCLTITCTIWKEQ